MKVDTSVVTELGLEQDYNHYRYTRNKNTPNWAVLVYTEDMIDAAI